VFYALMMLLLVLTIFIAPDIKGSHSWLRFGSFQIQPAEFAKYATLLCLAKFMSSYQFSLAYTRNLAIALVIIFLPAVIIIAQSETGSALVFVALLLVLFREGMNGIVLVLGALVALFFILVLRYNNLPDAPQTGELWGFIVTFAIAVVVACVFVHLYTRDNVFLKWLAGVNLFLWVVGGIVHAFVPAVLLTWVAYGSMAVSMVMLCIRSFVVKRKAYFLVALFLMGTVGLALTADYAFNKVLAPHQQIRIKIVLGLEDDPQGAGYNVRQSQIAIGSGGVLGKGYLNGTQTKLSYVPEQDTDFIFCTIGEEHGFVGSVLFIALYAFFMIRLIYLAERQRSAFSRIYGYGLVSVFLFHFFINLGMVTGITPVIGIPLPFISYGGSSLWGFTIMLFTFIRLDANRMEVLQHA
jgi:rod shape determining protein RodA